jgi:hypothetical protein
MLQKPCGFYSVLALTVEIGSGASPVNITKRRLLCTFFLGFLCQKAPKFKNFVKSKGENGYYSSFSKKNGLFPVFLNFER